MPISGYSIKKILTLYSVKAQKEFFAVYGDLEYPFAELLLSAGFFFVMVIEQTVMNWYEKKQRKEKVETTSKRERF